MDNLLFEKGKAMSSQVVYTLSEREWSLTWDLMFYATFWGFMILHIFAVQVDFLGLVAMLAFVFTVKAKLAVTREPIFSIEEIIALLMLVYVAIIEFTPDQEVIRDLLRPYLLIALTIMAGRGFMRNRKSLFIALFALTTIALAQSYWSETYKSAGPGAIIERIGGMKIFSLIGGPNGAGVLGATVIGLGIITLFHSRNILKFPRFLLVILPCFIVGLITLIFSYSRTAILLLLSIFVAVIFITKYQLKVLLLISLLVIGVVTLFPQDVTLQYYLRFSRLQEDQGAGREYIYAMLPELLAKTSLLGNGQEESSRLIKAQNPLAPATPHNAFIRCYMDYGIPGLILTLILYFRFIMKGKMLGQVSLANSQGGRKRLLTLGYVIILGLAFCSFAFSSNYGETIPSSMVLIGLLQHWKLQYYFETQRP